MKYKTEIEIDITPDQLAEMFVCWSDCEQSEFINLIGHHFKKVSWHGEGQICSIAYKVDQIGKDFIYTLANFLKVTKIKCNSPKHNDLINAY